MANTLKNTTIKSDGAWYNAYDLISEAKGSVVSTGTSIAFSLLSDGEVWFTVAPAKPIDNEAYDLIRDYGWVEFEAGETGIWVKAPYGSMVVNFKEL